MKVKIQPSQRFGLTLWLPTGLIFNRLTALRVPVWLRQCGITVTYSQICRLLRCLHAYRRCHRDWILAEIETADGDHIKIRL